MIALVEPGEIDDHGGLSHEQLRALQVKRDGPGIVRITVQLGLIAITGALTLRTEGPLWMAWCTVLGVLVGALFGPLHETCHRTAFASRSLNEVVAWICAFPQLYLPALFREFHFTHHRHTQDRARDPEIMPMPDLLDGFPRDPMRYLVLTSGQHLLFGKAMFVLAGALAPASAFPKIFPYVHERRVARIQWESRIALVVLIGGIALGLSYVPNFWRLLVAFPIAHLLLGIYLLAEHTGLPNDGTQNHRTRSVTTNALMRWLFWNMPLHAVHHMHPAIPFHAVPEAHRLLLPTLEHVSPSYLAVHREALAHAFRRR